MKFAHYIKATGEVISILNIPESRRDLYEDDYHGLIEMSSVDPRNDTNLVVVDGRLSDKPDGNEK